MTASTTIHNMTIHVHIGAERSSAPSPLAMLFAHLSEAAAQDTPAPADAGSEAAAPSADAPAPISLRDDILTFLDADARYGKRTRKAIVKHYSDIYSEARVDHELASMVSDDEIHRTTRRSDGEPLYGVN